MEFEITILQPKNYIHSSAFAEVMESLAYGFGHLGHRTRLTKNHISTTGHTIILGANLLRPDQILSLPAEAIVYNLEQITSESAWISPEWLDSMKGRIIWEYSAQNVSYWRTNRVQAVYVPIGYCPTLTRIDRTQTKDIDVVFYGSLNDRRLNILNALQARNLRIAVLNGTYGRQRDSIIGRSKMAINIHYYVPNIFEVV